MRLGITSKKRMVPSTKICLEPFFLHDWVIFNFTVRSAFLRVSYEKTREAQMSLQKPDAIRRW